MHLVDLSENRARFRTGVVLPPQAGLTFKWMGPSRDTLVVHGHVSETRMIDKRTAEYDIDFTMTDGVRDRLGFELHEVHRRRRDKVMNATAEMMGDFAFERVADRKRYRTVVQFPVTVQVKKNAQTWIPLRGEARDLSIGGMMLSLPEEFEKGTELELSFYLPFDHEAHDMNKAKWSSRSRHSVSAAARRRCLFVRSNRFKRARASSRCSATRAMVRPSTACDSSDSRVCSKMKLHGGSMRTS